MTLQFALRSALRRTLPQGSLYLPNHTELKPETPCVLVDDPDAERDDRYRPIEAVRAGFPLEGLDTETMEDTCDCARALHDPPSDELLVESFAYYLRYDAFLPERGAPEPPPWEETQLTLDREFYELLGPERSDQRCRRADCARGAISHSVLCKVHHFEDIRGRACPFDD